MKKKIEVLQEDKIDCGAACLLSIIRFHGGNMPLEDVKSIINTSKNGTNALDIINGAKEIGFDAAGKKLDFKNLLNYTNALPLIAHVKKGNFYHFVVIYQIDESNNRLAIMDPSVGLDTITINDFKEKYLGTVLIFSKRRNLPNIRSENKLLKVILLFLKKDRKKLLFLTLISLIGFILNLLEIKLFNYLIASKLNIITNYIIIILIFVLTKQLIEYVKKLFFIKTKYNLDGKVNYEVFKRLLSLPMSYYKNKTTGEIISRINDLDILKDLFLQIISTSSIDVLMIFFILYILSKESVLISIICIIFVIIYLIIVLIFTKTYKKKIKHLQESKGEYTSNLIEKIERYETISNLNIEENELSSINCQHKKYLIDSKNISSLIATEELFKNTIFALSNIIIILIGISFYHEKIMYIYILFSYLTVSTKSILELIPNAYFAFMNLEKVNQMLIEENTCGRHLNINGDIIIKDLTYKVGGKSILSSLNVIVKSGSKVMLTGQSGKGKSSLLKLILKYDDKYKGKIYIGNENLNNIPRKCLLEKFTYVSQNEELFTQTIRHNLVLNRKISEEKLNQIINICELENVINTRKLGLDTLIEEGGFNFSGGEKQRIILARALLKDSDYILIDEALSEVDLSLETKILINILRYYKNKTIIYISHKKDVRELFEKIFNVEGGKYEQ